MHCRRRGRAWSFELGEWLRDSCLSLFLASLSCDFRVESVLLWASERVSEIGNTIRHDETSLNSEDNKRINLNSFFKLFFWGEGGDQKWTISSRFFFFGFFCPFLLSLFCGGKRGTEKCFRLEGRGEGRGEGEGNYTKGQIPLLP